MQPNDAPGFRVLFLAEMDRLNARLREFGTEVHRQESNLRALYPWLAKAFRSDTPPVPSANDNGDTRH